MHMLRSKYILFTIFLLSVASVSAQKAERDYIRKGNRLFNDSVFVDAEVNYRKALEVNPKSTVSMYNLGNTLSQQQKFQDAMEQYVAAGKIEKDKMKLAHIYHNMGVLFQAGKDYAKAVEAYKMSLRNNPADDETRYNLALAQKMLKDQQQNQDQKCLHLFPEYVKIRTKIKIKTKTSNRSKINNKIRIKTNRMIKNRMKRKISNNLQNLKRKTIKCRRRMQNNYLIL